MAATRAQRRRQGASSMASVALLGVGLWLLVGRVLPGSFVGQPSTGSKAPRVALNSFKDEFFEWRKTLTKEEKELCQDQCEKEFFKEWRKTDRFKQKWPEARAEELGKLLQKFYDTEREDYQREVDSFKPDYDQLLSKEGQKKTIDFTLKHCIMEIDRDAMRRWEYASRNSRVKQIKGEPWYDCSPYMECWEIKNDDEASHKYNLSVLDVIKAWAANPDVKPEVKKEMEEMISQGVPKMGETFKVKFPRDLGSHVMMMEDIVADQMGARMQGDADKDKVVAELEEEWQEAMMKSYANYTQYRDIVLEGADKMKQWFRDTKEDKSLTKADVLRDIWKQLPVLGKDIAPLPEETLAELSKYKAIDEHHKHIWGIADKLYKSEALDAFGGKYLIGVYETKEECQAAFDKWNKEYEEAGAGMQQEFDQYNKRETARLNQDTSARDRILSILESARAKRYR